MTVINHSSRLYVETFSPYASANEMSSSKVGGQWYICSIVAILRLFSSRVSSTSSQSSTVHTLLYNGSFCSFSGSHCFVPFIIRPVCFGFVHPPPSDIEMWSSVRRPSICWRYCNFGCLFPGHRHIMGCPMFAVIAPPLWRCVKFWAIYSLIAQ